MEKDLKKISAELVKASGMHKSQAEKIDNLLERKDNKSIAKMIKKVKNSNCGSPSKALVFQPKNLNQHLKDKPNLGSKASETKEDPFSKTPEQQDGDPVLSPKEESSKDKMKKTIKNAKIEGLSIN